MLPNKRKRKSLFEYYPVKDFAFIKQAGIL